MGRSEFKAYIQENYGIEPDCPWIEYPDYAVFRHNGNKKMVCSRHGCSQKQIRIAGVRKFAKRHANSGVVAHSNAITRG